MISLKYIENNKDINLVQDIFYIKIKIESYKNSNSAQCFSCHQFGHSSLHCGLTPRCMKYNQKHLTKDCIKSRDTKATCFNCNGEYTANYRGCPSYIALINEKAANRRAPELRRALESDITLSKTLV